VLGGGGFLGLNLCRRLASARHKVRAFGHRGLFPDQLTGVEFVLGDFSNANALIEALRGTDIAFHLIHSTVPHSANVDIIGDVRQNLVPSIGFLELARSAGVKRVIFLSSGGTIYGRPAQIPTKETAPTEPITAYGICKLAIEKYLALYQRLYGLDYRILRVANPFGPFQVALKRQGLIAELIYRALRGAPVEVWGDGSVVRDFVFVEDVVDALELAVVHAGEERIFNIGSGVGRSVRDVLAAVEGSLGKNVEVVWKATRAIDIPSSVLSIARARENLGWNPKTLFDSGIDQTVDWWKSNIESVTRALARPEARTKPLSAMTIESPQPRSRPSD
jgi:UDP-glucose 4-epimerase